MKRGGIGENVSKAEARPCEDWWSIPCHETSDIEQLCKNPLVSVHMTTYNHGPFIRKAIEGVVMQETDFEYELLIGEDCSQDRTREICFEYQKKHPDKIRVLWSESNLWAVGGNHKRLDIRCRGKYIAFCEGDDYWTDPKKLQKQVEYMEAHPGCAGCFHERVKGYEDGRPIPGTELPDEMKHVLSGDDIAAWTFPVPATSTVLYRREAIMDRPERMNTWKSGDRAMALWAAYAHGTLDWVEGVQPSVYRIHGGGVYRGVDELHRLIWEHEISRMTLEQVPVSPAVRRENYRAWLRGTYWAWRKWHASESEEVRRDVKKLVEQDEAAWPMMRWWLWLRQTGYWLDRGRALVWHGMVSGMKRALPEKVYVKLRDAWRKRSARALNGRRYAP